IEVEKEVAALDRVRQRNLLQPVQVPGKKFFKLSILHVGDADCAAKGLAKSNQKGAVHTAEQQLLGRLRRNEAMDQPVAVHLDKLFANQNQCLVEPLEESELSHWECQFGKLFPADDVGFVFVRNHRVD